MAEFFHMGGYAVYVWSSYGLALLVLIALLVTSLGSLRRKERLLRTLEDSLPRRRRRATTAETAAEDTP